MSARSFQDLTIVSVTGAVDYIQGSIYAIMRSCQELPGSKGLLISPPLPAGVYLPPYIEHQLVAPFSYLEYNFFILYQLDYFIHTDYCLIVQNDGWVMNGKNWRDEFWNYDYIGAPVPIFCFYDKDRNFHVTSTQWYLENQQLMQDSHYIEPQNGGFSLRSKRLLSMPRQLGLDSFVGVPKPAIIEANKPYKMEWQFAFHNEDIALSGRYRHLLEKNGMRFAPSELASLFAVESTKLLAARGIPINLVMGGHWTGAVVLKGENLIDIRIDEHWSKCSNEEILDFTHVSNFINLGYRMNIYRTP